MKKTKLIYSVICLFFLQIGMANNGMVEPTTNPRYVEAIVTTSGFILITDDDLAFKMNRNQYDNLFENIFYDSKKKEICFMAKKDINFVQILTEDGDLEFQLPVLSKKLHLNIEDLIMGKYQINLISTGPYNLVEGELLKKI